MYVLHASVALLQECRAPLSSAIVIQIEIYYCLVFCQALRDGNKLAQMEEIPLFPGESIKVIGKSPFLIEIYEMKWHGLAITDYI